MLSRADSDDSVSLSVRTPHSRRSEARAGSDVNDRHEILPTTTLASTTARRRVERASRPSDSSPSDEIVQEPKYESRSNTKAIERRAVWRRRLAPVPVR